MGRKQGYTKTVDHNNKSGNDKKTCPYFEELSHIFVITPLLEHKHVSRPLAVWIDLFSDFRSGLQENLNKLDCLNPKKGWLEGTQPSDLITMLRHNMATISKIGEFRIHFALFAICSVLLGLSTQSSSRSEQERKEPCELARWRSKTNDNDVKCY